MTEDFGFGEAAVAVVNQEGNAAETGLAVREAEDIRAAIIVAKRFPRDGNRAWMGIVTSCKRKAFAEQAEFSFKRGGKAIEGGTIGLAREIARNWGNLRYGLTILSTVGNEVHIRGWAHDVETNTKVESEAKFAKLIQRKNRKTGETDWVEPDERDQREMVNRHGAICIRNCIFQVVPPDVVDEALAQCRDTLRKAAAGDLEEDRGATLRFMLEGFQGLSVTQDMLEEYLGHNIADVDDNELASLRSIYRSINKGEARREEFFDVKASTAKTTSIEDMLPAAEDSEPKEEETAEGPDLTNPDENPFMDQEA